ncbi:MAG: UDP-N-acetylmuramate--L-alanine ligase, partial [Armatimonadota bacterium]
MRRKEEIERAFSPTADLDRADSFFLVGIGGAGMSALARMLLARGYEVAGSDSTPGPEVERLIAENIPVEIGHRDSALAALHARAQAAGEEIGVIVTDAVDLENSPEVQYAHANDIPVARRSQALGWALKEYKVIAVTGTHGKTTTTGLIGAGLIAAGLDPLVVVGAAIPEWGGPVREGEGEYAVVEACEAYDAFHDIQPHIVVLANLEADHLDFHGTYENLRDSVVRFVDRIPEGGGLVYCADDRGASEVAELTGVRTLPYGLSRAWLQQVSNKFDLGLDAASLLPEGLELTLPGDHNRMNAAAALATGALLNESGTRVDLTAVEQGIVAFKGAERRLQVALDGPVSVVDDYAHHPSEIAASIEALRERYRGRRLIVVYQPHMYSRTRDYLPEFAEALSQADFVVLTDIYPA